MSDTFYKYYFNMKSNFKQMNISKIKKNKIFIKDGIFTLTFDLNNLFECSFCGKFKKCDYKKCKHIYFIFTNYYKLDFDDLFILWKNNNYDKLIENKPFDYSNEECGFCLDSIFYDKFKSYDQCLNCGSCYHIKCLKQYQNYECINCKNRII